MPDNRWIEARIHRYAASQQAPGMEPGACFLSLLAIYIFLNRLLHKGCQARADGFIGGAEGGVRVVHVPQGSVDLKGHGVEEVEVLAVLAD